MSEPELKPCPRCKSECYHQREGNCGMWRVMCRICHLHDPKWRETKAEATAWWNDRPDDAKQAATDTASVLAWAEMIVRQEGTEVEASLVALRIAHAILEAEVPSASQSPAKQEKDEPTHAAEDRPPKQHECPYDGWTAFAATGRLDCGEHGTLCKRCQEDRADARAGIGNRLLALEEYAAAVDARASDTAVEVEKLRRELDALRRALRATGERLSFRVEDIRQQTETALRLAKAADAAWVHNTERLNALESRLPGPQTPTQDLGTFDAQTGQRVDEPTQHGEPEARTCGNCGRLGGESVGAKGYYWCEAPLPMWERIGRKLMLHTADATHCAAWTAKEAKA